MHQPTERSTRSALSSSADANPVSSLNASKCSDGDDGCQPISCIESVTSVTSTSDFGESESSSCSPKAHTMDRRRPASIEAKRDASPSDARIGKEKRNTKEKKRKKMSLHMRSHLSY